MVLWLWRLRVTFRSSIVCFAEFMAILCDGMYIIWNGYTFDGGMMFIQVCSLVVVVHIMKYLSRPDKEEMFPSFLLLL